jgi:putative transposase
MEDLLHERGIEICHETVKSWWTRFGVVTSSQQKALLRYWLAVSEGPA